MSYSGNHWADNIDAMREADEQAAERREAAEAHLAKTMTQDFIDSVKAGDPDAPIRCATVNGKLAYLPLCQVWGAQNYQKRHDECLFGILSAALEGDAAKARGFALELVDDIAAMHVNETIELMSGEQ